MKVLLVDDEILVVESIKMNVNWASCGITEVFLCDNVPEGRKIVREQGIDLVITDIEMPGEDGLAFAHWIRNEGFSCRIMFLTGYAEFEYAREAVSLGAEDYLLKPLNYRDLEKKLAEITGRHENSKQDNNRKDQSALGTQSRWADFVNYCISSDADKNTDQVLKNFNIVIEPESEFLVLAWISFHGEDTGSAQEKVLDRLSETCLGQNPETSTFHFAPDKLMACFRTKRGGQQDLIEEIRNELADIVYESEAACTAFLTDEVQRDQLIGMIRKLSERDRKNVIYQNRVVLVGNRNLEQSAAPIGTPEGLDCPKCGIYLDNTEFDKLETEIDMTLHRVILDGRMDAARLQNYYNDFIQLIYHYVGLQFSARISIVSGDDFLLRQKNATNSVEDFRSFVRYVLGRCVDSVHTSNENEVIRKVKDYIDSHIADKLSRTEIAEFAGFNENYLSRLFHKEYGYSISSYIQERRLLEAKRLLIQTRMPVSEIGEKVGYDTTTYFIRIFKREVGMTPNDFRKEMRI